MTYSPSPSASPAIAAQIRQLQQISQDIDTVIRGRDLPSVPRKRMASGCLDLAIEHQAGIAALADLNLWGPLFALLRVQFEAFIRGLWLARCASERQIEEWFEKGKLRKHRTFEQLVTEVEAATGHKGAVLTDLRRESRSIFNDFTHAGYQHVVRRNNKAGAGSEYSDQDQVQALRCASAIGQLAAIEMLNLAGNEAEARELKANTQTLVKTAAP